MSSYTAVMQNRRDAIMQVLRCADHCVMVFEFARSAAVCSAIDCLLFRLWAEDIAGLTQEAL